MQHKSFSRRELWFVVGTATIYVIRRLIEEIHTLNGMIETAQGNRVLSAMIQRNLAHYDHTLNNNIPLIAGVCLFVVAWYVFHKLAYPKLQHQLNDRPGWIWLGITVLLLLSSTFLYHYLKLYVRYQHNQAGNIIGLSVYSLYRKRTVLADAIGLGILVGTYELACQYYHSLSQKIARESASHSRVVSYLLLAGVVMLLFNFTIVGSLPTALWGGTTRDLLLVAGLVIQIMFLQDYMYRHILPMLTKPGLSEKALGDAVIDYLLMAGLPPLVLWSAANNFQPINHNPVVSFIGIVLIASASIACLRWLLTQEKTVLQTEVSAKSAELESLQAQINPHFLFNALNSLYATALKEKSEKTADGIQKLGDMMRFMLQENNRDRIPLDKEIEYLRNYIQIQRMRIDESHDIEIRINIQEPDRAIYLAPMLLTPFVENAFKYGISLRHASWIYITLTLDDTRLYVKVHNSRHPQPPNDPEATHTGVGLDNVLKRLQLIYPGQHQLDIQASEQDYFVSLTLVYW